MFGKQLYLKISHFLSCYFPKFKWELFKLIDLGLKIFVFVQQCANAKEKWQYFKQSVDGLCWQHRLTKITDRALDVVFSRFGCFSFTIIVGQKPIEVPRMQRRITRPRESMRCLRGTPLGILPQGYCERNTPKSWKDDI